MFHEVSQDCSRITTEKYSTSFSSAIKLLHKDLRQRIHDIADVRLAMEGGYPPFSIVAPNGQITNASDSFCDYTWNRDNAAGKKVAPGVYFAVIREEGTLGEAQVFQTVKKILLQ